jgi:hypothetical protein
MKKLSQYRKTWKNFRSCEKSASQININDMCECVLWIIIRGKIERRNWNLFLLLSAQNSEKNFLLFLKEVHYFTSLLFLLACTRVSFNSAIMMELLQSRFLNFSSLKEFTCNTRLVKLKSFIMELLLRENVDFSFFRKMLLK